MRVVIAARSVAMSPPITSMAICSVTFARRRLTVQSPSTQRDDTICRSQDTAVPMNWLATKYGLPSASSNGSNASSERFTWTDRSMSGMAYPLRLGSCRRNADRLASRLATRISRPAICSEAIRLCASSSSCTSSCMSSSPSGTAASAAVSAMDGLLEWCGGRRRGVRLQDHFDRGFRFLGRGVRQLNSCRGIGVDDRIGDLQFALLGEQFELPVGFGLQTRLVGVLGSYLRIRLPAPHRTGNLLDAVVDHRVGDDALVLARLVILVVD